MKLLITTLLLYSSICFSQKQYEFDYLIEYELTFYKDSIRIFNRPFIKEERTIKKYYLTNSKKNNYTAVVTELDSLNYKMIFRDQEGIYSNVSILKSSLNNAEFVNIDCRFISRFKNPYKSLTNDYEFVKLSDTLINEKAYSRFRLGSIKPKVIKRKKLGTENYIMLNETAFHLPVLDYPTSYEEWKTKGKLSNGIFLEKYFIDYYGKLDSKEKLINFWKIDKKIVIPRECDYTADK